MKNQVISEIRARQILDSRGNPTVEADVFLSSGSVGRAIVPSGASTGSQEALELRDGDEHYYGGKGVLKAVWNVNNKIRDLLVGNLADQKMVDQMMIELDGTKNKASLGANAILAVSLATAKAVAKAEGQYFYEYVAKLAGTEKEMSLPMPMMNVINGGEHAGWATDIQEYMIVPKSAENFSEAMRMGAEVFHSLKKILAAEGYATTVGDEGGYAPKFRQGNTEPLEKIRLAIERTGYRLGYDFGVALDVAASEFKQGENYILKLDQQEKTTEQLVDFYEKTAAEHHILSIEDGLGELDYPGWKILTSRLGQKIQLVGDDLFVTNSELIRYGIAEKIGNAVLIKPNQIGTLTETIEAVMLAKQNHYNTIISHRSGESEDTSIAHLAVGLGAGQIKTGSLSRSERIAKYNELLRISENTELKLSRPF